MLPWVKPRRLALIACQRSALTSRLGREIDCDQVIGRDVSANIPPGKKPAVCIDEILEQLNPAIPALHCGSRDTVHSQMVWMAIVSKRHQQVSRLNGVQEFVKGGSEFSPMMPELSVRKIQEMNILAW
jgi:hypothetical protein